MEVESCQKRTFLSFFSEKIHHYLFKIYFVTKRIFNTVVIFLMQLQIMHFAQAIFIQTISPVKRRNISYLQRNISIKAISSLLRYSHIFETRCCLNACKKLFCTKDIFDNIEISLNLKLHP